MFAALFHDECPADNISTQFNALGSLLKCPGWVGKGSQCLKIKICISIYQTFVLEANTTFVCLEAPSPQNNKAGKCLPPWLRVSAELFLKNIESQKEKSETFNQKGTEWFPLHLITTSSLSLDEMLYWIPQLTGGRGQSSIGKLHPSPFKINGGGVSEVTFSVLNASPSFTPGSSEAGRNLVPAGWSSERIHWGCKLRLSLLQKYLENRELRGGL